MKGSFDNYLLKGIYSAVSGFVLTLLMALLPLVGNATVRQFVVSNTEYTTSEGSVKGSLAAAVDSVNKYSLDSCAIVFDLKESDTIIVDSNDRIRHLISNETYLLIDGGGFNVNIKSYSGYFGFKGAKHVVIKNLDFPKFSDYGLHFTNTQVDTIVDCTFDSGSGKAIYGTGASSFDLIENCIFSNDDIGVFIEQGISANINKCVFKNCIHGIESNYYRDVKVTNSTFYEGSRAFRSFSGYAYKCNIESCQAGLENMASNGSVFEDCDFKSCETYALLSPNIVKNCRFYNNAVGIQPYSIVDSIVDCKFHDNDVAIHSIYGSINNIINNEIIGSQKYGIEISARTKHIYDNYLSNNGVGIHVSGSLSIDSLRNNTIELSSKAGIEVGDSKGSLGVWEHNYIGTNSNFENRGNGGDGIAFLSTSLFPNVFKDNFIGFNNGYGVYHNVATTSTYSATYISCYVGTTPDSLPMSNAKDGIIMKLTSKLIIDQCKIGYNGGCGVRNIDRGTLTISNSSFFGNGEYGVYKQSENTEYNLSLTNCVFDGNGEGAVYNSSPEFYKNSISQCLFLNTKSSNSDNLAIENIKTRKLPAISKIAKYNDGIIVDGKVDTIGKVFVELFLSDGSEVATNFLYSDSTDADGRFSFKAPTSLSRGAVTATVSYAFDKGYSHYSSALATPVSFDFCDESETTVIRDTIIWGDEKDGVTYKTFGLISTEEALKSHAGCDSVVVHELLVRPNPDSLNYYVKTEREGKGDGSSWENAMNGEDFAACLPLAPNGATFYVAAGTYSPKYDQNLNIPVQTNSLCYSVRSDVNIIGGYPANATVDSVISRPSVNRTIFNGDVLTDDYVQERSDDSGFPVFSYQILDNNCENIITIDNDDINVSIDGIVFENATVLKTTSNNVNVNVANSEFYHVIRTNLLNIQSTSGSLSMKDVFIHNNNIAPIVIKNLPTVKFDRVRFEDNNQPGQLIQFDAVENFDMNECVAYHNNGTKLEVYGGIWNIVGCDFGNNYCGRYCFNNTNSPKTQHQRVLIENSKFHDNIFDGTFNLFSTLVIDSCEFTNNELGYSEIYKPDSFFVKNTIFTDNIALKFFNVLGGSSFFKNCNILRNKSSNVFYDSYNCQNVLVDSCKFVGNQCRLLNISAVRDAETVYIVNSVVDSNLCVGATLFSFDDRGLKYIDSTVFSRNYCNQLIALNGLDESFVRACVLDSNIVTSSLIQSQTSSSITLTNSTLSRNESDSLLLDMPTKIDVYNNTIVQNKIKKELFKLIKSRSIQINNNTIIANETSSPLIDYVASTGIATQMKIEGNIFISNTSLGDVTYIEAVLNNLCSENCALNNSIVASSEDLNALYDGIPSEVGPFNIPTLSYRGGFTPVVALANDKLRDGTIIRFPRTSIGLDQRGEFRLDMTCMGAYEIKCSPSEKNFKDTIELGDSYTFRNMALDSYCQKVGSYYFSDTLRSSEGCDSIINLSLAVRPHKNDNGYYVKVDGTGDGSDWNNAMSPEDFAEYLPLVYDGETFHIAAGDYRSSYEDTELGRMYNINSSVTLIGGYPDTVTTVGVPPMPENYTTTLKAKAKGDDHVTIYTDRPGDYSLYGFNGNDSILIRVNGAPTVTLYGLTLSGVTGDNYGAVTMNDGGVLNIDRCSFTKNNASSVVASNVQVNMTASRVFQNVTKDGAAFRLKQSDLNVVQSTFNENISSGETSGSVYSQGAIADLTASQAFFTNNTIANNWADRGAVFALDSSNVTLTNNTMVGNHSILSEPTGSFVTASDLSSTVTLFGNMIVGNGAQPVDGATIKSEGYNIFSVDFQGLGGEKDMYMSSSEYETILDGKPVYGNAEAFVPNLGDNGGFTPTIAVIESMFDGGAVISIPSDVRKVQVDQRGMIRKDTSCVGAFEFPTYVNYFVKQNPVGDGTGRDWDNAMGDTTFARYFSIVPTGATFHVAAGTYHPLEDRLYKTNSNGYRRYYTSRPLNVFGGYEPQAKNGAVADPSKYKTLLSADFNGDDHFEESTSKYSVIGYTKHEDNSSYVMDIKSKVAGSVHLKGLSFSGNYTQFRGSSAALTVSTNALEIPLSLVLDSCSFEGTYVGVYSNADTAVIRGCRFDTIVDLAFSHSPRERVPSVLSVENSSFSNLDKAISVYAKSGKVLLQNSTFNNARSLLNVNSTAYNQQVDLNLEMYHNTFGFSPKSYQGIYLPNYIQTTAKGNIFNTNFSLSKDYSELNAIKPIISDYNLFVEQPDTVYGAWILGEHDMLIAPEDLEGILPGTMAEKRFHAVSELVKPEHYTKVVALISDILKDGEYLRMPIEESTVSMDQIATERLDLTCLGAYELFSGRDTIIVDKIDTVCLGLNYQRDGWNLQSDTLVEGQYAYERFARGKIATDTIFNLDLHVNPFDHIKVDQVKAQPTLCHGDGFGIVSLTPRCVIPGSANVYVINSYGDTVSAEANTFNTLFKNEEMLTGRYTLSINPITQCVVDTTVSFEILDRDSLHAMPCADMILTSCANEPTSELKISLVGYHPAMKFYYDSVEVNTLTKGFELISDENSAVTSLADVRLSEIPVGFHTIYAIDACENQYPVKEFTVAVPASELVDMELVEYTMDSLPCGLDLGKAKVHVMAGASANFSLKSSNGYTYDRLFTAKDTVLSFEDLPRGKYEVLLKKYGSDCTDSAYASFEIKSPEPLTLSLTSNGAACAEGMVKVSAQGGRGNYVYHWTNPLGEKADSVSSFLNDVSAGNYICVVEDSVHCLSLPDTLTILPNVDNLSPLSVDSVASKNITCFKGNNGTIEVYFSTENVKQSVACSVTNKETGEVIGTSDTYERSKGLLAIRTLPVGTFSYEVYYGTETCRLDTTSFKGDFSVAAKAVPFTMDPLKISSPQTCLSEPDGVTVNNATGWEDDYKVNLISSTGGVYPMTPVVEGGVTKLYAGKLSGGHSYYYQVLDACGSEMLTESVEFPLYEPLSLTVDSHTDSVTCARAKDAQITFTVSGGILDNHKAFVNDRVFDDKGSIVCDEIGKGDYYVSFKSVNASCPDSVGQYVRIAGPDTLAIKYTLTGNCATSKLIASASGECGSYSYLWNDGEQSLEGDDNIPFALEAGKTYSLTITDDHGCDQFEKKFTIPTADQLPSISQKVYPESEKCYQGNNGSILVQPSLSAPLDFAITATVSYRMVGSDDSVSVECVLDPDYSYSTPRELAPGEYQVVTYLGSMDCDMGVAPAVKTVKVDALPPLKIQSEFFVTDHTCFSPNGSVQFNVEGWTYTHTADIYKVGEEAGLYMSDVKAKSTTSEYVGIFDIQSMPHGLYKVVVKDICGNSDESDTFEIQYKPTTLENISTKQMTCINEPNGVLDFEVHGWTSRHGCSVVKNDNVADGRISPALPERIDEEKKIAYFHIDTMQAGKWRIWVANECGEAFHSDDLNEVKGIDPYKIELLPESKLELDCPYDTNAVIALKATGGYSLASFSGNATHIVSYYGPTGKYVDSTVLKIDTSFVVYAKYDSLNPIIKSDTVFKFSHKETVKVPGFDMDNNPIEIDSVIMYYDTVVNMTTTYPQMTDENGNFINDTILSIDTFDVKMPVMIYGMMDSLCTSPITYNQFEPNPSGSVSGQYTYINLQAGTYRFTYKSELEGCSDKYNFDTKVTKPADVKLNHEVMPISCSTSSDGVISLAPRRGDQTYSYFTAHDPNDEYLYNRLYIEQDGEIIPYRSALYRIDQLWDQSDFKVITWSHKPYESNNWAVISDIVFPDSTDITEEIYYKDGGVTKDPVYSNSHLESFWHDKMGESFVANVITISNLEAGYYSVLVQDAKYCQYHDTFEVKLPERPLQIDSVVFDEGLATCDPTKRQILAYASGGWGEYNFTFSDFSVNEETLGEQSDGFRGGEATHYDKSTTSGWGVSQFLDPGNYTVVVLDEQGCMVQSKKEYAVKSNFRLQIDSTSTKCPEDPTAQVEVKFIEYPTEGMTYDVVEFISSCRNDTLDDCRDSSMVVLEKGISPVDGSFMLDLTSLKMRSKTHGLFVYQNDENHCGTYVQGTVVDTIPIFQSSRKAVRDVSCHGLADGMVELYVNGGTAPYLVQRNSSWNAKDELALYKDLNLESSNDTLKMRDPETGEVIKDTIITNNYLTVSNTLQADDYYFTVIDAMGCKSVMGDTASFDEKIVVKQPDLLEAEFVTSLVCKAPSVTKGGNVFFKNVKGGVEPYKLACRYMDNGTLNVEDNCGYIQSVPPAVPGLEVGVEVMDANQCSVNANIVFKEGELQVDTFDFWATSWYDFGDVVALIDVCGPEETFDSVAYVFRDENGNVDPRVKMLDKRLYIYDLDGNKEYADIVRRYGDKTKELVSDAYFEKYFNLRSDVSQGQAKHLNFFKFEDTTIANHFDDKDMREALAEHTVLMKAYFMGCEYQMDKTRFLGVINPNVPVLDSIGQKYQIISLTGSPNPFKDGGKITITAKFTEKVKNAKIRIYHIDGKASDPIDIKSDDLILKDGEYVFSKEYDPSKLFESGMPDYIILFLTTDRDQKSATLLHSGVNNNYWK